MPELHPLGGRLPYRRATGQLPIGSAVMGVAEISDQAMALHLLRRRFPGTPVWFGSFTRHWWALFGDRLIEATAPEELGRLLDGLRALQPREGGPTR